MLVISLGVHHAAGQDHGHLRIGAYSPTPGAQLYFYNGADFASTSGYVKTLVFTNSGRYSNYYQANITVTVQAVTPEYGGPEPDAPALGSYIRAVIAAVEGPPGGAFGFWESGASSPTISVASGQTATNNFNVTQTDGSPTADPFGHIHGRRFTATMPGIYTVTFRAFDSSSNGADGGPIHTPSETIKINFQAGVNIASIVSTNASDAIKFGALANYNFWLESTSNLNDSTSWKETAGPMAGTDYFQTFTEVPDSNTTRFYRIKMEVAPTP
jgi:hypothetical protein